MRAAHCLPPGVSVSYLAEESLRRTGGDRKSEIFGLRQILMHIEVAQGRAFSCVTLGNLITSFIYKMKTYKDLLR